MDPEQFQAFLQRIRIEHDILSIATKVVRRRLKVDILVEFAKILEKQNLSALDVEDLLETIETSRMLFTPDYHSEQRRITDFEKAIRKILSRLLLQPLTLAQQVRDVLKMQLELATQRQE